MRFYAILLCLLLVIASCKDEDRSQENETNFEAEQSENNRTFETNSEKTDSNIEEDESVGSPDNDSNKKQEPSEEITSGSIYVKMDESDANCSCYCIELDMNNNTELCLSEDKMYINARYSKSGNNVNIYYVSPSNKNTNRDLPWQDFDTNIPIAVLSPGDNDQMELDWKGFYIDGELAIDYAIYGKKTLEGNYKKQ